MGNGLLGTNLYKAETRNTCRIQTDIPSDRLRITCKGKPVDFKLFPCPELEGSGSLIEFETEAGTATQLLATCE